MTPVIQWENDPAKQQVLLYRTGPGPGTSFSSGSFHDSHAFKTAASTDLSPKTDLRYARHGCVV